MSRSSHPAQLAPAAPLLRVVLLSVLLIAAFAGVLVTSGVQIGWVVLGVAVVAGPVAVIASPERRRPEEAAGALRRAARTVNRGATVAHGVARGATGSSANP